MKHLFIVNPTAGKKDSTEAVRAKVEKAFENRDDSYEIFVTSRPMEAPDKIKEEAKKADEEKARLERIANPTVEDLLKDIKVLLEKSAK